MPLEKQYFTKHLLRTGLECPTRLYYRAKGYPENREALPFIEHYRYNKQQMTDLARCSYPNGKQVQSGSPESDAEQTGRWLEKKNTVLFDPVFIHGNLMANVPILDKKGDNVEVFHVQTKSFRPERHNISDPEGEIYSKWTNYILDFAFEVYVIGRCYPDWDISTYLLLPSKYARARNDRLHEIIKIVKNNRLPYKKSSLDNEELLVRIDVYEEIQKVIEGKFFEEPFAGDTMDEVIKKMTGWFFSEEKYPVTVGAKCRNCEFRIEQERVGKGEKSGFLECWNSAFEKNKEEISKSLVFNLIGPGIKHWIERDIYFKEQVPEGEFYPLDTIRKSSGKINAKQRQSLQILQARKETVPRELVKPRLFEELQRWEYPIHFLDFEAGNYVIPLRKNRRPYHLVVFQFSCHSLQADGSWSHHQWIDGNNGDYSNYELLRNLRKVPGITEGTLVQYSNFERNALKIIRKELMEEADSITDSQELADWTMNIINRNDSSNPAGPYLSDLSRLVRNYYYNAQMEDSLSIKDVLQSIMSVSPRLKELYTRPYSSSNYDEAVWWQPNRSGDARSPYRLMIENEDPGEGVRRGTEAMVVYAHLLNGHLSSEEEEKRKNALLRYCELDTLAMVMIYQHWKYLMDENWN